METLPSYIPATFIATTLLALFLLYKASGYAKVVLLISSFWLLLQGAITLTGFYQVSSSIPPRFVLLLMPPLLLILILLSTDRGRKFIDGLDVRILTIMHSLRIPVELVLYTLYVHHWVPGLMTFEGGNLDILSGISALFIYYFAFVKHKLGRVVLILWNMACLLLLANIVVRAICSAPFPFQRYGFDQPNIALFHFPFSWLPGFVVPVVLLSHLVSLRKLILNK